MEKLLELKAQIKEAKEKKQRLRAEIDDENTQLKNTTEEKLQLESQLLQIELDELKEEISKDENILVTIRKQKKREVEEVYQLTERISKRKRLCNLKPSQQKTVINEGDRHILSTEITDNGTQSSTSSEQITKTKGMSIGGQVDSLVESLNLNSEESTSLQHISSTENEDTHVVCHEMQSTNNSLLRPYPDFEDISSVEDQSQMTESIPKPSKDYDCNSEVSNENHYAEKSDENLESDEMNELTAESDQIDDGTPNDETDSGSEKHIKGNGGTEEENSTKNTLLYKSAPGDSFEPLPNDNFDQAISNKNQSLHQVLTAANTIRTVKLDKQTEKKVNSFVEAVTLDNLRTRELLTSQENKFARIKAQQTLKADRQEQLSRHGETFVCCICQKKLENPIFRHTHILKEHQVCEYMCKYCGKKCSKDGFYDHKSECKLIYKNYLHCKHCNYVTSSLTKLEKHLKQCPISETSLKKDTKKSPKETTQQKPPTSDICTTQNKPVHQVVMGKQLNSFYSKHDENNKLSAPLISTTNSHSKSFTQTGQLNQATSQTSLNHYQPGTEAHTKEGIPLSVKEGENKELNTQLSRTLSSSAVPNTISQNSVGQSQEKHNGYPKHDPVTGFKEYCHTCGKYFSSAVHYRIHVCSDNCTCLKCNTLFATVYELQNHKRSCSKACECTVCGKLFQRRDTCKRHEKSAHRSNISSKFSHH